MTFDRGIDAAVRAEFEAVFALYCALSRDMDAEVGLGGKLVYAGELDGQGSQLVRAANIAGAASLSATADAAAQRAAIREGVIDFLVTSLDEALRILKNEIRKRNAVAVGIGLSPDLMIAEMRERGVLPDLLAPDAGAACEIFVAQGARRIEIEDATGVLLIEHDAPVEFEKRVLELLPEEDYAARRWLRLSPRYLGPRARRLHSVGCDREIAARLSAE